MPNTTSIKIFAVEDDPVYIKFLSYVLALNPDFETHFFSNGEDFLNHLHENPSIVTLDYTLPDMPGEEILRQIKNYDPEIDVIIISGQDQIGTAVDLLKMGAYDYITKDVETKDRLLNAIGHARKKVSLLNEINELRQKISSTYSYRTNIIGNSSAIEIVFKLIEKAAGTKITVSITGETGTGKELVAKAIHYNSKRKNKKFVAVNLAAIPENLLESELFGHEKGSFTGAITRRIGVFEEAQEGTIFLDEIGEVSPSMQLKILRVIQERELSRIGNNDILSLDLRVIVATHKDLAFEVESGNFREDLYYRLLGLPIVLPPLRKRGNDIIIIAKHLLKEFCQENDLDQIVMDEEAKQLLLGYHFPGNVRELKSIVELAAVMCNGTLIRKVDISFSNIKGAESILLEDLTLKQHMNNIISHYLDKNQGNVLKTAKQLDIGKSTIYRYLQEV